MISIRQVEQMLNNLNRAEKAQILQSYPSLRAEDLVNAWAYYRAHRAEIDEQIVANEAA